MEHIDKQSNLLKEKRIVKIESVWVILLKEVMDIYYFVILPNILDNEVVNLNMYSL